MAYPHIDEIIEMIELDDNQGWCTNCEDWTHDYCEPDASRYTCPVCEKNTVYAAEQLLIMIV